MYYIHLRIHFNVMFMLGFNGLKFRLSQGINVKIYPESGIDVFNAYLRSISGLSVYVFLLDAGLIYATFHLLAVYMEKTEHLSGPSAIPVALAFAAFIEVFAYVAAINGWYRESIFAVVVSTIILRGTFGSMYLSDSPINFFAPSTWDFNYLLSWVLTMTPPVMNAMLCHRIKQLMDYNEMAKEKLKIDNPDEYRKRFGNF